LKANPEWLETVFICDADDAEIEILHHHKNKMEESFDSRKLISYLECIETNIGIKSKIKSLVRKLCLSTKRNFSIYDLLVCPICKGKLLKGDNQLTCIKCGAYPIINNIPVMMRI
jgi:exosome complex RNA-binding protein Csl4